MNIFGKHEGRDIVWDKDHQIVTWDGDQTFRVYEAPLFAGGMREVFSVCIPKDLWEHDTDTFLSKLAELAEHKNG